MGKESDSSTRRKQAIELLAQIISSDEISSDFKEQVVHAVGDEELLLQLRDHIKQIGKVEE